MLLYHLWLLIQKSLRYAWRCRSCRCCPKIIFELLLPLICILFLILIRWIHTKSKPLDEAVPLGQIRPSYIELNSASTIPQEESMRVFNYTSMYECPPSDITIEIVSKNLLSPFKRQCPRSSFDLTEKSKRHNGNIILNNTVNGSIISYRCRYDNRDWCHNNSVLKNEQTPITVQHPSLSLCSSTNIAAASNLLRAYLATASLLNPPPTIKKKSLSIYSWPCSSYVSDPLFQMAPAFTLITIFIFIDGCILYSFNLLFHSLIDEKHQGITELLRLISVRPILNSFAWFLRIFIIQLIPNISLILILKLSFDGGIYLPYVSIWLIIPTIILWSIQVLSRAILVGHFFSSNLKASLWSWFIYVGTCWLAVAPPIRLSPVLHLIASAWLPFYSIKRLMIILFRINNDLGRAHLTSEVIFIWFYMLLGSLLMWLLAYYFEQVRPGKYGIPRPWSWPLDYFFNNRFRTSKQRQSIDMQMVETLPDVNTTVRINNLTKTYGRFNTEQQLAVDHISFKLEKSIIHGLIGHNGAGKTSTMEMMCGLLSCNCGTIEIHNKDLHENLDELKQCIGYCPQQDMLFSHLTVREQLEFYARVRSKGNNVDYNQIKELLTMMDMNQYSHRLCHALSGGMQRKLSILCAFVGQANVIILDEPSSSLDPAARRVLWSWLRENKINRTLLISSHLLDEVEELCDSIIILDAGKIRAQGTVLELKQQFGPPGDRLHLDKIPTYIPTEWIIDKKSQFIQVPNRQQLISLLEKLEQDSIKYSLENVTLDEIFLKLTSSTEGLSSEESTVKSSINTLFDARTSTNKSYLWSQQAIGVLIRRGNVLLKRARLLPIILLFYVLYAFSPLYMPSSSSTPASTAEHIRYIISSSPALINKLPLKKLDAKFTPSLYSAQHFERYLSGLRTWQSDNHRYKTLIGLRISSLNHLECYVPSPFLYNVITSCLPVYISFYNYTLIPFKLIPNNEADFSFSLPNFSLLDQDSTYYCFYTLPPRLHLAILLLSTILLICAALIIQDHSLGFHSYSLIHGLRSSIHWTIVFLSDLVLCLIWTLILILIERFVHSSTFNGRFFALAPLLFIGDLPFIYLIAKLFKSPILGATIIVLILQFTHFFYTFRVIIEFFRGRHAITAIIHFLKWALVIIFPNINVFTLMVTILRPYSCSIDDSPLDNQHFSNEHYPHKLLIHILILIGQFIFYFILLIFIDTWKLPIFGFCTQSAINQQEEDNDVTTERQRIETMNHEEKQNEAVIIDNISKYYHCSINPAVNRLTFAVPHRECFGLLGFNGSDDIFHLSDIGKTTTFRMLVGELQPSHGHIYKNNKDLIGYCPQDDITFSALTVLKSIDYICRIHGLNPSSINNLLLSQFQLEKYRHRLISHLSGGTRRRLHLALCLIGSPTLLLLDEPTAKVDPLIRSHIRLILQNRPVDTSIVFASHSMLECEQLCDRLTILVRGNARCLGSPRHLKNKYGNDYRIRLTLLQSAFNIPLLQRVDNTNEYTYPKNQLSNLFKILEDLVAQNIIASNYTVQLTSLEHIFLGFQHTLDAIV
ncbi:unnamed protein product [Rotaria socialis]|uniref:ABC transporter domain-containing protein n=1 Tax=Rotaria socialis TaxID=392032 RepID=A0A820G3Q8_9BILA|nr:unnamed protein product [Rotaria socialis]CAF4274034.1 unnamed protein product [Rotaria socialis]